jgi:hypothetical protein
MTAETQEKIVDGALKAAAFFFGAAAFIFSILGGDDGSRRLEYISYGVACLGATTIIAYIESGISRRSQQARDRMAAEEARRQEAAVESASAAAVHLARIGGLRSAPTQELVLEQGRLDQSICTAAARIHPGSRAVFYAWNSGRFECAGMWTGSPKVVNQILPGDFGFSVLRHTLRTGGVYKRENVKSYLDGPPTAASKSDNSIVVVAVRAGQHEIGILAMDTKMDSWTSSGNPADGYPDPSVRHLLVLADLLASGLK